MGQIQCYWLEWRKYAREWIHARTYSYVCRTSLVWWVRKSLVWFHRFCHIYENNNLNRTKLKYCGYWPASVIKNSLIKGNVDQRYRKGLFYSIITSQFIETSPTNVEKLPRNKKCVTFFGSKTQYVRWIYYWLNLE